MKENINMKKYIICLVVLFICMIISIIFKLVIDAKTLKKELDSAEHAITINEDVRMYASAKEKGRYTTIGIGSDTYILNSVIDKSGNKWYKVKIDKKIGYVKKQDIAKYKSTYKKRDVMVDVSKFNMQNGFKSIGEFKAFLISNNIKFVYIRAGGRGYGKAGNFYTDPNADEYANACEFLKIPFGYYFLEEAISSEEVDEEVNFINKYISEHEYKYNILPVALDVEKHDEPGRADKIWDTRYILVNELVDKIEKGGKRVILYSNARIANKYLTGVNAKMWLAYYPQVADIPTYWYSDTDEEGAKNKELISKLIGWQFSESGAKNSIDKKIDLSIVYSNYLLSNSMKDVEKDIKERNEMVFGPINNIRKLLGY